MAQQQATGMSIGSAQLQPARSAGRSALVLRKPPFQAEGETVVVLAWGWPASPVRQAPGLPQGQPRCRRASGARARLKRKPRGDPGPATEGGSLLGTAGRPFKGWASSNPAFPPTRHAGSGTGSGAALLGLGAGRRA